VGPTHDLKAGTLASSLLFLKPLSDWILAVEVFLAECLVDDCNAGKGVVLAEISAIDEGYLHGF
jgi:hypothetical protein